MFACERVWAWAGTRRAGERADMERCISLAGGEGRAGASSETRGGVEGALGGGDPAGVPAGVSAGVSNGVWERGAEVSHGVAGRGVVSHVTAGRGVVSQGVSGRATGGSLHGLVGRARKMRLGLRKRLAARLPRRFKAGAGVNDRGGSADTIGEEGRGAMFVRLLSTEESVRLARRAAFFPRREVGLGGRLGKTNSVGTISPSVRVSLSILRRRCSTTSGVLERSAVGEGGGEVGEIGAGDCALALKCKIGGASESGAGRRRGAIEGESNNSTEL
jgi:hypothetical protein